MPDSPERGSGSKLNAMPFSWQSTKDGSMRISRGGRVVTKLGRRQAGAFLRRLEAASDPEAQQLLMARATGNYKRGNERRASP